MTYNPNNREPLIRARTIDVDNLIVQGDITLVGGGTLKTSAGGVIEVPAGSVLTVDGTMNPIGAVTLPAGERMDRLFHATSGMLPVGYTYYTGVTSDTETVTINGRVYEFDTGGAITGDVLVDISGGNNAAQSAAALIAAINGDAARTVEAIGDTATDGVLLVGLSSAAAPTLATTCVNGVVSAAAFVGNDAPGAHQLFFTSYTVTADDETRLSIASGAIVIAGFPTAVPPVIAGITVLDDRSVVVATANTFFTLEQPAANYWVLKAEDDGTGAGELGATFVVSVLAIL